MRRFDAVIAGAGAAGMFCAVQLGWRGKSVAVIEHSGCQGRKLMITGKGRCNVTNNCTADTVMKNIPRNSKFMYSALSRFAPEDVMSFFECLGVELKTERGNRVFPVSDNAKDIVKALVKACEDSASMGIITQTALSLQLAESPIHGQAQQATAIGLRSLWGIRSRR